MAVALIEYMTLEILASSSERWRNDEGKYCRILEIFFFNSKVYLFSDKLPLLKEEEEINTPAFCRIHWNEGELKGIINNWQQFIDDNNN